MKKINKVFVALVVLSLMAAGAGAGNLSPGITNIATTLEAFSITITSPEGGQKLMNENINLVYTQTGTGTATYTLDDVDQGTLASSPVDLGALAEGSHTVEIIDDADGVTVLDNVIFSVDRFAPADVTDLANSSITTDSITWSWNNPTDLDFSNTRVTVVDAANVPVTGYNNLVLANTVNTITVSGLSPSTAYTITVKTEDDATAQ